MTTIGFNISRKMPVPGPELLVCVSRMVMILLCTVRIVTECLLPQPFPNKFQSLVTFRQNEHVESTV